MHLYRPAFIVLISCLILQACGNLPQPFRRFPESSNPLLANPSGLAVGVLAPDGFDEETADQIAAWITAELQSREVLAEAVERAGVLGFTLEGNLRDESSNRSTTTLTLDWRLLNRSGEIIERMDQRIDIDSTAELTGRVEPGELIAIDIATQLSLMIAPPVENTIPQEPQSQWANIAVSIQRPQNAPGDGAQALGIALANRLSTEGFKPATGTPDIVISAIIGVVPYDATQDDITIVWQVLSAAGENIGEVRLDNRIPRGELDETWGLVADAIVDAAVPGILDIIASSVRFSR